VVLPFGGGPFTIVVHAEPDRRVEIGLAAAFLAFPLPLLFVHVLPPGSGVAGGVVRLSLSVVVGYRLER
jgi:hypothetical protein